MLQSFGRAFLNLTKFKCSHTRDAITYTHDIFLNRCKRPHNASWKMSNLVIENKYHHLTLQKNPITFEQGCIPSMPQLLMAWRRKEPGHQQQWYWSFPPDYSSLSVRMVNFRFFNVRQCVFCACIESSTPLAHPPLFMYRRNDYSNYLPIIFKCARLLTWNFQSADAVCVHGLRTPSSLCPK